MHVDVLGHRLMKEARGMPHQEPALARIGPEFSPLRSSLAKSRSGLRILGTNSKKTQGKLLGQDSASISDGIFLFWIRGCRTVDAERTVYMCQMAT